MKRIIGYFLIAACVSTVSGRVPAELKADLNAIKPAGCTNIKMVYIKATNGFQEFAMSTQGAVVWVVSIDEPKPRRIYPTVGSANCFNVNLTADGKRVIIWNNGRGQMVVVNWDGTNAQTYNISGTITEYWHAPDGSDWAINSKGGTDVERINIDSKAVVTYSLGSASPQVDNGSAPVNMSDDGKYLLLQNTVSSTFGLWDIVAKKYKAGPGGCQPSMRAGSSNQYNVNISGHHSMGINNPDGTAFMAYRTADTATTYIKSKNLYGPCNNGDGITQEGTRFTQHPDYVTFFLSNSKANPILSRLPDMKPVYIEDSLDCNFVGDMDAVFIGATSPKIKHDIAKSVSMNTAKNALVYSIQGRRIDQASLRGAGIVQAANGIGVQKVISIK